MSQTSTGFEKFADILEKKIRKQIEAEMMSKGQTPRNTQENTTVEAHDLLGSLLTSMNPVHFYVPQGAKKYPHRTVKPKPRPAHVFNAEQAHAFQYLLKLGADLLENFNKKELETAFRALALKLHPDQGGSNEKFRLLLDARNSLKTLL